MMMVLVHLPSHVFAQSDTTFVVTDTIDAISTDTLIIIEEPVAVGDTVLAIVKTDASEGIGDQIGSESSPLVIPAVSDIISFGKIFMSMLVLLIVWLGSRFVSSVLINLSERFSGQRLFIKRLVPIVKVVFWSGALYFIIAGILQPPLETIITVSASIGIAVGFASQDILRNIFGGIMIILDRPFQVGDKIEVDKQYGEVIQIGLRSVRIVTEDDSMVTVPNAEIMNKSVSNANSSALDCQVVAELFLPRTIDTRIVQKVCRKAAMTSRFAYLNKPVYVHVTHVTVGPRDLLKVRLKAYVLDIRFEQELRSDMTTMCMEEFNRLNLLPTA
jgi:small-conductance mechanosensitive channel